MTFYKYIKIFVYFNGNIPLEKKNILFGPLTLFDPERIMGPECLKNYKIWRCWVISRKSI